jgi:hypothetical protein
MELKLGFEVFGELLNPELLELGEMKWKEQGPGVRRRLV